MKDYLTMDNLYHLLGAKTFREVMALPENAPILVTGPQYPTGKSTVVSILEKLGYTDVKELFAPEIKQELWAPAYVIVLNTSLYEKGE